MAVEIQSVCRAIDRTKWRKLTCSERRSVRAVCKAQNMQTARKYKSKLRQPTFEQFRELL